MIAFSQAKDQ